MVLLGNGVDALADLLNFVTYDGYDGSTFGADTIATSYFLARTGSASEGLICTAPYYGTEEWVQSFEEAWATAPGSYAAQGYDAMMAIIHAWRMTDKAYNYGMRTDGPSMARKMMKVNFEGASGDISFNKE